MSSFKGKIFLAQHREEKLAREKEQHAFRKIKQGLNYNVLQSCLEERVHAEECGTVESVRFPPWFLLCFYYGKM